MRCPRCGYPKSRVIETRESESAIRRRRECKACQVRYTTYERPQFSRLVVRAPNGSQRNYTRRWLANAVRAAASAYPDELARPLAAEVESQLRATGRRMFTTEDVGAVAARAVVRLATEAGAATRIGPEITLPGAAQVTVALDASMPPKKPRPSQLPLPIGPQLP